MLWIAPLLFAIFAASESLDVAQKLIIYDPTGQTPIQSVMIPLDAALKFSRVRLCKVDPVFKLEMKCRSIRAMNRFNTWRPDIARPFAEFLGSRYRIVFGRFLKKNVSADFWIYRKYSANRHAVTVERTSSSLNSVDLKVEISPSSTAAFVRLKDVESGAIVREVEYVDGQCIINDVKLSKQFILEVFRKPSLFRKAFRRPKILYRSYVHPDFHQRVDKKVYNMAFGAIDKSATTQSGDTESLSPMDQHSSASDAVSKADGPQSSLHDGASVEIAQAPNNSPVNGCTKVPPTWVNANDHPLAQIEVPDSSFGFRNPPKIHHPHVKRPSLADALYLSSSSDSGDSDTDSSISNTVPQHYYRKPEIDYTPPGSVGKSEADTLPNPSAPVPKFEIEMVPFGGPNNMEESGQLNNRLLQLGRSSESLDDISGLLASSTGSLVSSPQGSERDDGIFALEMSPEKRADDSNPTRQGQSLPSSHTSSSEGYYTAREGENFDGDVVDIPEEFWTPEMRRLVDGVEIESEAIDVPLPNSQVSRHNVDTTRRYREYF